MRINGHEVDPVTQSIYKKVADEHNISPMLVHKMVVYTFRKISKVMKGYSFPRIMIFGFGTFTPMIGQLEFLIRGLIWRTRKSRSNRDYAKHRLYYMLKARKRLIFEHYSKKANKDFSIYDSRAWRKQKKVTKFTAYNENSQRKQNEEYYES